jgi:hypothetical protein
MKQTNPHNSIANNVYCKFKEYCYAQGITLVSQVNPIDIATFKMKYNVASSDIRELQSSLDLCFADDEEVHEYQKVIVSDETPDSDKMSNNDPDIHSASKALLSGNNGFDASIGPRTFETPSQRILSFPIR